MVFKEAISFYPHLITESSIIERLKREFNYLLDDALSKALMNYDEAGNSLLEKI